MKNIVILGAGFGGLRAAIVLGKNNKKLRRKGYQITLIDKNRYHTYTPLLYEISTTSKETANYLDLKSVTTYPIEGVLLGLPIEFIEGEIQEIDLVNKKIQLAERQVEYEYLIIALGAETNFFDIPGLKENALELKSLNDALKIRDTVWEMVEGAAQNEAVDIVIGGAGSTGVELAGEIQEWLSQLKKEGYRCRTSVTLIDAAPAILSGFDPRITKIASQRLKKLDTSILTEEKIDKVENNKAYLASGKIVSFDLLIWTGGVKANSIAEKLPVKYEKQSRIGVLGELLCAFEKSDLKAEGNVYGIGDIVCVPDSTGKPVPMVARAAIIQGTIAAKNIVSEIKGKKSYLKYNPKEYPYIIPVGGKYAIAKIGPFTIVGFFGWILKGLVELNYLFSIMPNMRALRIWLRGLRIFIQNDRLG
ncbi:MAG: NAD(P)/FAD-dependent oxidoreductase [Candidatus Colwellbacteria bacterium]|nr:NAD(P)/FAD-dependent oxidoreductase [Candidatus Colwellbacteria bacterium]